MEILRWQKFKKREQLLMIGSEFLRAKNWQRKDNEKFIYGCIKEGARAREYEEAIEWLVSAGMLNRIYNASKPEDEIDEKKIREALSQAHSVKIEKTVERQNKVAGKMEFPKTMDTFEALEKYIQSKSELKNIAEDMKKYAKELLQKYGS